MNRYEMETVVTTSAGDSHVTITTYQRKFLNRLKKHPKATLVDSGEFEGVEWGMFQVPAADWNPVTGIKRTRVLTPEQREAAGQRLAKARSARTP